MDFQGRTLHFILATTLLCGSVNSLAGQPVDASAFDIAGVKLGMSYNEAVEAATAHLGVSASQIKPGLRDSTNPSTNTALPASFSLEDKLVKLYVRLVPRVPLDKGRPQAVSSITYSIPRTKENTAQLHSAAITKYGPPSNGTQAAYLEWCLKPSTSNNTACTTYSGPTLRVMSDSLNLRDMAYEQKVRDFLKGNMTASPTL